MLPEPRIHDGLRLSEQLRKVVGYQWTLKQPTVRLPDVFSFLSLAAPADALEPIKTKHQEEKAENECPTCGKAFKNKQGLNKHFGKAHGGDLKTHPCPLCEKMFKHKHAVQFHLAQVHYQSTRIECDHCDKTFYNKYELKKHSSYKHPTLTFQ